MDNLRLITIVITVPNVMTVACVTLITMVYLVIMYGALVLESFSKLYGWHKFYIKHTDSSSHYT